MRLIFIDSNENKHLVTESAINIMIDKLDENNREEAGVKLLLYMAKGDEENKQRLAKTLKTKLESEAESKIKEQLK